MSDTNPNQSSDARAHLYSAVCMGSLAHCRATIGIRTRSRCCDGSFAPIRRTPSVRARASLRSTRGGPKLRLRRV